MEAIVLAGGFGSRLAKVVPDWPKPMAPVAGRPFLELLLLNLARQGITRVLLSLHYMAHKVQQHFGARFGGMELEYVIEEQPLGTGGALRYALQFCHEDLVLACNGDTYLEFDLSAARALWLQQKRTVLIGCRVEDASRYGRLQLDQGLVCGFLEKGAAGAGIINAGCYVLARDALAAFPVGQAFSLETDYLTPLAQATPLPVLSEARRFIDIGIPQDYARAQDELADLARTLPQATS